MVGHGAALALDALQPCQVDRKYLLNKFVTGGFQNILVFLCGEICALSFVESEKGTGCMIVTLIGV